MYFRILKEIIRPGFKKSFEDVPAVILIMRK